VNAWKGFFVLFFAHCFLGLTSCIWDIVDEILWTCKQFDSHRSI